MLNRIEKVSMGNFKEITEGFINIFSPHIGSNKGQNMVEQYEANEIYMNGIKTYNITFPPPSPVWQTNPAYCNIFIFKDWLLIFYDLY